MYHKRSGKNQHFLNPSNLHFTLTFPCFTSSIGQMAKYQSETTSDKGSSKKNEPSKKVQKQFFVISST